MNITLIKILDKYIGTPLCYFFGLLKTSSGLADPKKILVIQLWGMGETFLTIPALLSLRKKFPNSTIDVLATDRNAEVYDGLTAIDAVRKVEMSPFKIIRFAGKNAKRYDLVIDMEEYLNVSALLSYALGSYRVGFSRGARSMIYHKKVHYNDQQHVVLTFLDEIKSVGGEGNPDTLTSPSIDPKDRKSAENALKKKGVGADERFVCVAPGTSESARCRMWPLENYSELCDYIAQQYKTKVVFTGTAGEKALVDEVIGKMDSKEMMVNLCGELSLGELFFALSKCALFIGNDSGSMHAAAAVGAKTIGLFGPNVPLRFGPYGKGNAGVYKGEICEFSPCINVHLGEVPDCLYPKASKDYQKCMKNISVGDVINEVDRMIK